jgi:Ribulose-5-phosphate 4-epimerase and related epimerases and aldolases
MFLEEKKKIIKTGMQLDRYNLIALSGGNISSRMPTGEILVSPSGMIYEEMVPDDVLVMDIDGNIIEGTRKSSSDTDAILYIFANRPDVNGIIHTHQPYATAISLIQDELEVNLTTLGNACGGPVKVSPFSSAGSVEMGIDTVKYIGESLAIILAQHGVITIGKDVKQALYSAVYLEECAKAYLAARAVGPTRSLTPEQIQQSIDVFKYYGQDTAAIPKDLTKRL